MGKSERTPKGVIMAEPTKEEVEKGMETEGKAVEPTQVPEEGKTEQPADAGKPEPDWKKQYADSTKEVNENLLPKVKSYDYMMAMVDKHPSLAKSWEDTLAKESGIEEAEVPANETTNTAEDRLSRLEKEKREEGIAQANEAISEFRGKYPDLNDSGYDAISKTFQFHIKKYAGRMSFKNAVIRSLEDEYFLSNKDKLKDEGRREEMVNQRKLEDGTIPQTTSSPSGSSAKDVLTPGQKSVAENLGVKIEDAAKYAK